MIGKRIDSGFVDMVRDVHAKIAAHSEVRTPRPSSALQKCYAWSRREWCHRFQMIALGKASEDTVLWDLSELNQEHIKAYVSRETEADLSRTKRELGIPDAEVPTGCNTTATTAATAADVDLEGHRGLFTGGESTEAEWVDEAQGEEE
ncbi:hypothetical protein CF327_g6841 [Tilletia walkeri]|uniref:Uncharacterized protein n=1 Tax=Tilletia walkeri TaxID=117179 RepID=A0A8X7N3G5_9BASI|nr:hypothetical protein CF327_g6841 [Tilletia walkeri]KAE8265569.1 hypothetical protein A4X09_0g6602 [Tilletia walkeri]